jgi:hypothetical protein
VHFLVNDELAACVGLKLFRRLLAERGALVEARRNRDLSGNVSGSRTSPWTTVPSSMFCVWRIGCCCAARQCAAERIRSFAPLAESASTL